MTNRINVTDFNLAATLECGQAFRWSRDPDGGYTGVIGHRVCRLRQDGATLHGDIDPHYLALDLDLSAVAATFPADAPLQAAVKAHWGLRVLRQEPWETLASYIASSTKQIVQIRQIVALLAARFGQPLAAGHYSFPAVAVIARATPQQLLDCKLGFRAKYLLAAAKLIDGGKVRLADVPALEYERAVEELLKIPGVGEKIANCTLLFSCGFHQAFPVDVWVARSVKRLYFPRRKISTPKLRAFTRSRFGPYAGWAQQYLFYAERQRGRQPASE